MNSEENKWMCVMNEEEEAERAGREGQAGEAFLLASRGV